MRSLRHDNGARVKANAWPGRKYAPNIAGRRASLSGPTFVMGPIATACGPSGSASHRPFASRARDREVVVPHFDLNVLPAKARYFRDEDVLCRGFVEVDRRHPSSWSRCKAIQSLLDGEEITNRVPSRKRHGRNRSTAP